MKKVLSIAALLLLCFTVTTQAQISKEDREARREALRKERAERAAIEAQQDSVAYLKAVEAMKAGAFVLEADFVGFPNGLTRYVTSSTNYLEVNEGNGVLQTAFSNFSPNPGPNGLGGVTVEGSIGIPKLNVDKEGNVYYNFNIQGIAISATVFVTLTAGTNQATASISPNFNNNNMTMTGRIVPYDESYVIQGNTW